MTMLWVWLLAACVTPAEVDAKIAGATDAPTDDASPTADTGALTDGVR